MSSGSKPTMLRRQVEQLDKGIEILLGVYPKFMGFLRI
jgi:hypothetical protein